MPDPTPHLPPTPNPNPSSEEGTGTCQGCGRPLRTSKLRGFCARCLVAGMETVAQTAPGNGLFEIPGHVVLAEIDRGGMGIVYRARQLRPDRDVALKMLLPGGATAALRERFRNEARTMSELDHPAVLPLYQFGEHGPTPWFTMKLASGGNLAQRLVGPQKVFSPEEGAELIARLADALGYAHQRGVLHRDVKPANILFDSEDRVYLADFGLAKLESSSAAGLTRSTALLGTPAYMAPEVAAGKDGTATVAGDIYALGAVFYELLARHAPFTAENVPTLLRKIVEEDPPSLLRGHSAALFVPKGLAAIVGKAMAKDPNRRYPSAQRFAADIRAFLSGEPLEAKPAGHAELLLRSIRRHPLASTAAAAILCTTLTVAVVQYQAAQKLKLAGDQLEIQHQAALAARTEMEDLMSFMSDEVAANVQPVGRLDLLEPLAKRATAYFESVPAVEGDTARPHRQLRALLLQGNVYEDQAQPDQAITCYAKALAIARTVIKQDPSFTRGHGLQGLLLRSMGDSALSAGRAAESEQYCREALVHVEAAAAESTPDFNAPRASPSNVALAFCLRSLGAALARQPEKVAEARQIHTKAQQLCEQWLATHPGNPLWMQQVAFCEYHLGLLDAAAQDPERALSRFSRQVSMLRAVTAESSSVIDRRPLALGLVELSAAQRATGALSEAHRSAVEAVVLSREFAKHDRENADWQVGFIRSLRETGLSHQALGEEPAACGLLLRALFLTKTLVEKHPAHEELKAELAKLQKAAPNPKSLAWPTEKWLTAFEAAKQAGDTTAAQTTSTLGQFAETIGNHLLASGRPQDALEFYQQAAARTLPENQEEIAYRGLRWEAAFYENRIAEVLEKQEKPAEALPHFLRALKLRRDHLQANRSTRGAGRVVSSTGHVVRVCQKLNLQSQALGHVQETLEFLLQKQQLSGKSAPSDVAVPLVEAALAACKGAQSNPQTADAARKLLSTLQTHLAENPAIEKLLQVGLQALASEET